ncbi:MAG: Ig-like domain-containing protein [Lachnospiraceae bacterium]|nr:Ig-like domain-containing protein [Lachnospiraceae bacterium]
MAARNIKSLIAGAAFCLMSLFCVHEVLSALCLQGMQLLSMPVQAASETSKELSGTALKARLSADTVKVGNTVKVKSGTRDLKYSSSDTAIAYVDQKGVVTGKKPGKVTITVKKKGYTSVKLSLTVEKKKYKPNLVTLYDEIKLVDKDIKDGMYQFCIQNKSKGKIKKLVLTFSAEVVTGETTELDEATGVLVTVPVISKRKLKVTAKQIAAGTTSKIYQCQAPASGFKEDITLEKAEIYAGSALVTYNAAKNQVKYGWGTKDKKAPKITGLVGKNSYSYQETYITLYKDMDFDFSKYIKAEDDRDGKVKITVDTDSIDYSKPGIYKVKVTAQDKAGNIAKETVQVQVRKKGTAETMADSVLSDITKASWSDEKKARAIYKYVKAHVSYTHEPYTNNWPDEAVHGFRYGYGDCFTYYSLCKALLNRAGIPNLKVQRNTVNPTHYWNMVYVKGGWYHLDSCWRQVRCYLCLLTDEQLTEFSNYYKQVAGFYSNTWDQDKYPASAKEKITDSYR